MSWSYVLHSVVLIWLRWGLLEDFPTRVELTALIPYLGYGIGISPLKWRVSFEFGGPIGPKRANHVRHCLGSQDSYSLGIMCVFVTKILHCFLRPISPLALPVSVASQ